MSVLRPSDGLLLLYFSRSEFLIHNNFASSKKRCESRKGSGWEKKSLLRTISDEAFFKGLGLKRPPLQNRAAAVALLGGGLYLIAVALVYNSSK